MGEVLWSHQRPLESTGLLWHGLHTARQTCSQSLWPMAGGPRSAAGRASEEHGRRAGAWPRQGFQALGSMYRDSLAFCSLPSGGGIELSLGWGFEGSLRSSSRGVELGTASTTEQARAAAGGSCHSAHFPTGPAKPCPTGPPSTGLCCTGEGAAEAKRHPVSPHQRWPNGTVDFPWGEPNQSSGLHFPAQVKQKIWNPSAVMGMEG